MNIMILKGNYLDFENSTVTVYVNVLLISCDKKLYYYLSNNRGLFSETSYYEGNQL